MNVDRALIVIPTYNERENVVALINRLLEVAPAADVLLVDDNSPDGTAATAEQLFGSNPRFSSIVRTGLGPRSFGRSVLGGFQIALERGYGRIVEMDADFSHDPEIVPQLIGATGEADVAIGSRYCPGGRVVNWPWFRRFLSRFANQYVSWITGLPVHDSTSGFRCYTRRALQNIVDAPLSAEGYAFLVETIFRAHRAAVRIVEIPITFVDRRAGQSKMSTRVVFESVLKPWRIRFGR
jgi:dolichol-phosphate mannosyltransferase